MKHKLCPSLAPRKVVSHQFRCASPWSSPLLPGKLRPSKSMENAGQGRGSCIGQLWPKATFLLSPGVTLVTTSCQPELQAVQLCSRQIKMSSPDLMWKDRRARVIRLGRAGPTEAAGWQHSSAQCLQGGWRVRGSGEQG